MCHVRSTALALIAALAVAAPTSARAAGSPTPAPPGPIGPVHPQDQIILSGRVNVPRGTTVGEVVVFRGRVQVAGVVRGDVVVLDGPISVSGQVSGSVVAIDGNIVLTDTAQVAGDVLAGGTVTQGAGAQVAGDARERVRFTLRAPLDAVARLLSWLAVSVSALLLGLLLIFLAPRGADRVWAAASSSPWASVGWGLVLAIGVPMVSLALLVSLVGLPLGLAVLLALSLLYLVGFTWSALAMGRLLVKPPRASALAFLLGWAILRVIGLIPVASGVTVGLAAIFGIGAMTVATWRVRGRGGKHRAGAMRTEEPPIGLA